MSQQLEDNDLPDVEDIAGDSTEEFTFTELLANVMMNDEIIITIDPLEVERTKTGIKNAKAKQAAKLKADNLPVDNSTLSFYVQESDMAEMIDLRIVLSRKSTVRIKKIRIPDGEM